MSFNGYAGADRNYEPAYSELALLFVIVAYLFLILVLMVSGRYRGFYSSLGTDAIGVRSRTL